MTFGSVHGTILTLDQTKGGLMVLNHIARLVAVLISIAAGTISVIGLAAIFSGAFWAVVIVASILEVAKVVTATWLEQHWKYLGWKLKGYLVSAVVVLMLITSLGIYGFFARAHIEQQIQMTTGETSRLPLIVSKITVERQKLEDLDKQIAQIDNALSAMTEKSKATRDAKSALTESKNQRKSRDELVARKDSIFEGLTTLEAEKSRLENVVKKHEVEVGPLKYLANLYYGEANENQLEQAVRFLILTLVFVFDPLAIALFIAANHTASTLRMAKSQPKSEDKKMPSEMSATVVPLKKAAKISAENTIISQQKPKPIFKRQRKKRKALDLSGLKLG